ncbi:MAG: DnaJ domain-containing protein [Cyanobacteria bacterium P01_H01_bin.162]
MNIEQGLFQFDLTDYHAILGVSIDADAKQIRKRYLKIARKLHPDSLRTSTDAEKQQANELLSKLVNPAYETLTQEKTMTEHLVVLRLRGKQLSGQSSVNLTSEPAKALVGSQNAGPLYTNSLKQLAEAQYDSLDQVLAVTGQISELNLAYLVSTADSSNGASPTVTSASDRPGAATRDASAATQKKNTVPLSPKRQRESIIDSYLNRANEFVRRKEYSRAIMEMREAVKSHPTNVRCHSHLAEYYLAAGQAKMAKIHLKRAIAIDPSNDLAQQLDAKLNVTSESAGSTDASKTASTSQAKSKASQAKSSKSKGGLFGLFGGKQK